MFLLFNCNFNTAHLDAEELGQALANYSPLAKSEMLPVLVNSFIGTQPCSSLCGLSVAAIALDSSCNEDHMPSKA